MCSCESRSLAILPSNVATIVESTDAKKTLAYKHPRMILKAVGESFLAPLELDDSAIGRRGELSSAAVMVCRCASFIVHSSSKGALSEQQKHHGTQTSKKKTRPEKQ